MRKHRRSLTSIALTGALTLALLPTSASAHETQPRHAKPAVVQDGNRWYLRHGLSTGVADRSFVYGSTNDPIQVMGDWDGDGVRTPGVIHFHGDRDGDGRTDMVWYLRNRNSAGYADTVLSFGEVHNPEDIDDPIVGDWDGDGDETVGVVRPNYREDVFQWLLKNENTSGSADVVFEYGRPANYGQLDPREPRGVPVVGDWDGNGTTTPGVNFKRPREGSNRWLLRNSNRSGEPDLTYFYGIAEDLPIVGDWDGDGDVTPGVHRRPNHWYLTDTHDGGNADVHFRYGSRDMRPRVWR